MAWGPAKGDITITARFDDLTILSRGIAVIQICNQRNQKDKDLVIDVELRLAIIQFMNIFRIKVFGDPSIF